MAYYNLIKNQSTFIKAAKAEKANNFEDISDSAGWQSAVSLWSRQHLFACRVLCTKPEAQLSLLADGGFYRQELRGLDPCISCLISGPEEQEASLASKWEPQIVRQYRPDSLGSVWAALAPFLRAEHISPTAALSDRPVRTKKALHDENFVSSASLQIGSSSPTRPGSGDSSSASSIGYHLKSLAPPLEDLTVRLASCLIRCIINYAQPDNQAPPLVCYRDERQMYEVQTPGKKNIQAIDDGGVQLVTPWPPFQQIALLEGKRDFQTLDDGTPTVSD